MITQFQAARKLAECDQTITGPRWGHGRALTRGKFAVVAHGVVFPAAGRFSALKVRLQGLHFVDGVFLTSQGCN